MPRPQITAETLHVDDLVSKALRGRIRVPRFQRGLRWRDTDVRQLFDSIHRGFPIGTLLMWKRSAKSATLQFGPVEVHAPSDEEAWWVVDGQQRLTSLVAGLCHPRIADTDDPFVVYFDLEDHEGSDPFFRPNRLRPVTPYSLPLAVCYDSVAFQEWLFDFVQRTGDKDRIAQASAVQARLRNYRVPVYVVETEDFDVARQIFLRVNRAGRRIEAHEVFAALAPQAAQQDLRPESIAGRFQERFGDIEPNVVAKAAKALVSDEVTRSDLHPNPPNHEAWMQDTERALCAAVDFLRSCGMSHARLLPSVPTPLVTLTRFFHRHPEPHERNRRLLQRWLWRGFFADALGSDAKTLRRSVVAVGDDESHSVQELLSKVPKKASPVWPKRFDARHGMARLAAMLMALEEPFPPEPMISRSDDEAHSHSDVFGWLQAHGAHVFCRLPGASNSPAARFLVPGTSAARLRDQLLTWAELDLEHPGLRSHLVSPEAAQALLDGDPAGCVAYRAETLSTIAEKWYLARAEPDHSDRPPLDLS